MATSPSSSSLTTAPTFCRSASKCASPDVGCDARDRDLGQRVVGRTAVYLDSLVDPRITVVHSERNIGQNAYAEAFRRTSAPYLVELDDDVVDAPEGWDHMLLDAFVRLPSIGFLAADLEEDPHDEASYVRHHVRPHEYTHVEENGVRLLRGPAGGGCAITSRELNRARRRVPPGQEAASSGSRTRRTSQDIERLGYGAAVLADLRVHHTGGPYYTKASTEKEAYWSALQAAPRTTGGGQAVAVSSPLRPAPQRPFRWFQPPHDGSGVNAADRGDSTVGPVSRRRRRLVQQPS